MEWIVARHISNLDGTRLAKVEGHPWQIKELLVELVRIDKKNEAEMNNNISSWDFGTEDVSEVEEKGADGVLYAFGNYSDFHIDYTAQPTEFMDLRIL